jgi:hypothetical protein
MTPAADENKARYDYPTGLAAAGLKVATMKTASFLWHNLPSLESRKLPDRRRKDQIRTMIPRPLLAMRGEHHES